MAENLNSWVSALERNGSRVKGFGGQRYAQCPCHDDKTESLSLTEKDGKILVKCHAGCAFADISKALGMQSQRPAESAVEYVYTDEQGNAVHKKRRNPGKKFVQSHKTESGWQKGLGNVRTYPYRIYDCLKEMAFRADEPIYFVEGEKDVDTLWSLGKIATTQHNGASGAWPKHYSDYFKSRKCVVLFDNDGPGILYAQKVAKSLREDGAPSVKVVALPRCEEKEDVTDWFAVRSGTVAELDGLVAAGAEFTASEQPSDFGFEEMIFPPLTDLGNAMRIKAKYSGRLCFTESDRWFFYNGKYWREQRDILSIATEVPDEIFSDAGTIVPGTIVRFGKDLYEKPAEEMIKWARKSGSYHAIIAAERVARSMMPGSDDDFDRNPDLLNVANGTIDLTTGEIHPHNRDDKLCHYIDIEYDKNAKSTLWDNFIKEMFSKNAEPEMCAEFFQRWIGYSATGRTNEQKILFCLGAGNNGKSVAAGVVRGILGGLCKTISQDNMAQGHFQQHTQWLYKLRKCRSVFVSELPQEMVLDSTFVKRVTGSDTMTARPLYGHDVEFIPKFTPTVLTNALPIIKDMSLGMWRRVLQLNFQNIIPDEKVIPDLHELILARELPGILRWVVDGAVRWNKYGLGIPEEVKAATKEYKETSDTFDDFVKTCLKKVGEYDKGISLPATADLYAKYSRRGSIGNRTLAKRLRQHNINIVERNSVRWLVGYAANEAWIQEYREIQDGWRSGRGRSSEWDDFGKIRDDVEAGF